MAADGADMEHTGQLEFDERIRRARRNFVAMAATYTLGVFNDNFFKQAMSLIAISAGLLAYQGWIAFVFTLPFVVFAAPAGWLGDRFPKGKVVIASKTLELLAMLAGAAGIITGSWPLMFVMLAIMATQSTIFSPSLNGSIPELYPPEYVFKANSTLKAVTTVSIVAGLAAAGFALDVGGRGPFGVPMGRFAVAAGVVAVALVGLIASFGVPRRPAASPRAPFPWSGPADTIRTFVDIVKDTLLAITIGANAFFWFIAVLQVLLLNVLGKKQFGMSDSATGLLAVAELLGVATGGLAAGRLSFGRRWYRILAPSAFALGGLMTAMAFVPMLPRGAAVVALYTLLAAMGVAGGFFLVPAESFIQVRPPADRKGEMYSAANFAAFSAMLLSGPGSNLLTVHLALRPTTSFAVAGVLTMLLGVWLAIVWNASESRRSPAVKALLRAFGR